MYIVIAEEPQISHMKKAFLTHVEMHVSQSVYAVMSHAVSVGIYSDKPRCWTDGMFFYPLSVQPIMLKLASRLRCVTLNERMIVNHEL